MITQKDIDSLKKDFSTKFQSLDKKLDKIITMLETSSGNLKRMDEEHTILSGRQSEHSDELEYHDQRINTIEKKLNITPTPSSY